MSDKRVDFIRGRKFPFRVADIFIFAVAVILTIVLTLSVYGGEKGNGVEIVCGDTRMTLPLSENTEFDLCGHLTVEIKGGECRVKAADCKNLICVKTGKISRVGESIVCAQNKAVITVVGKSDLAGTVGRG